MGEYFKGYTFFKLPSKIRRKQNTYEVYSGAILLPWPDRCVVLCIPTVRSYAFRRAGHSSSFYHLQLVGHDLAAIWQNKWRKL